MFREIRTREKITERDAEHEEYKKIRPESDMAVKDAMSFWNNEFEKMAREASQGK